MVLRLELRQSSSWAWALTFFFFKKKFLLFNYFQRQGKRGRKRERNISGLLLTHPQLGTWTATQPCALTGNRTCDFSVCRPMLNPLSHPSQGLSSNFLSTWYRWDLRQPKLFPPSKLACMTLCAKFSWKTKQSLLWPHFGHFQPLPFFPLPHYNCTTSVVYPDGPQVMIVQPMIFGLYDGAKAICIINYMSDLW